MTGITLTRKRAMIVVAAVLVVVAIAVVILTRNTSASAGPLRHDDTLRNTTIEKTWHTKFGSHGGPCVTIEFRGEISGNARPTWGITGPATVWEHLRVHNTRIQVAAYELSPDGTCGEPAVLESLRATLVRKTGDSWVRVPNTGSTFNKTSHGSSFNPGFAGGLDGGAYDRGESYRPTLGIYVEPSWGSNGTSVSNGDTVSDTFEVPAD